jgi:hypothetical protein
MQIAPQEYHERQPQKRGGPLVTQTKPQHHGFNLPDIAEVTVSAMLIDCVRDTQSRLKCWSLHTFSVPHSIMTYFRALTASWGRICNKDPVEPRALSNTPCYVPLLQWLGAGGRVAFDDLHRSDPLVDGCQPFAQ